MAVRSQLHSRLGLFPPLMYVASSLLATSGAIGLKQNISTSYDSYSQTWSSGNRSSLALTPSSSTPTAAVQSTLNDSANWTLDALPTLTVFNYYNESAAAAEWAHFYDLIFSWQGICLITVFCTFIVVTVIGNTLIILAVITTRRLRTVTNCFVMSLAIADLLVGIFVMPPAVAVHLIGSWQLGWVLCDIWISFDVLLCTASILSLCAISVDRYLAVTQPLTYSRKRRSKRLAFLMILIVWILALAITCPPMLGCFALKQKFKRYTAADVENEYSEQDHSMGYKNKPTHTQTFSNQTLSKDLQEIVLSESDNFGVPSTGGNCQSLLALPSPHCASGKSSCYELTRPSSLSLKRTSTASTTITTMTSGIGPSCSLLDAQWQTQSQSQSQTQTQTQMQNPQHQQQQQQQQKQRAHSFRHSHLSVSGGDRLRSHHHHHQHQTAGPGGADAGATTTTNIKSLSNRITSLKKENKTTQTLSIVVGGFIACWLPFFVYYLITPFLAEDQVSATLTKALTWLGWFNSAINPFIYAFYSVDFRAAFWRLTCKRFWSDEQKPQFPTNTMSIRR
ncbi:5-hydroxytryptamine receptor 1A [Drosophila navojoa]|nr:5-hydroxytryptamine receptor 1A [Drosophila navojoa]